MASPAQILRSVLIDLGLVLLPDSLAPGGAGAGQLPGDGKTYCFVGSMPNDIDQAIRLTNMVGKPGGRCMDTGEHRGFPGIKILVRALNHPVGYDLAHAIALALDTQVLKIQTTVPEDGSIHYIQAVSREPNIVELGEEVGTRRQLFAINARLSFQAQEPPIG